MAPTASDPKDLKLLLNPARRRALMGLVFEIITYMRSNISKSFDALPAPARNSQSQFNPRDHQSPSNSESSRRPEYKRDDSLSARKLLELKRDTLAYFDKWANEVKTQLRKTCEGPEDPRSDQRRREFQASRETPPPPYTITASTPQSTENDLSVAEAAAQKELQEAQSIASLQKQYHPIPTRLTTISYQDRIHVISSMVLLLLSLGHYSAHSRLLLLYLTSALSLPYTILSKEETEIARTLLLASKTLTADSETQARQQSNASSRAWKVGLASIGGAVLIGVTGGLAAPVVAGAIGGIMGGVGLGGVASFLGIFAMNGALVGSLFGAFGGKMTGQMVDAYAKEVEDFKFVPIAEEWGKHGTNEQEAEIASRRLRVTIGVNGWLNSQDDVTKPWRVLGSDSEVFALRYEVKPLLALGNSLNDLISSTSWSIIRIEILKRTVLATLWSALWPIWLLSMATSLDTPFSLAKSRSEKAGRVLADALINKAQGERPVTLIGYSLGSRVIYSCLKSLAERRAFGLVEEVVFIGSPIPSDSHHWTTMRSVVSGKVTNVYSENDYILAFLYRATSIQLGIAGLQKIDSVGGVTNLDLSKEVSGHLRYPELIGKILKKAGMEGVLVTDESIEGDLHEIQLVEDNSKKYMPGGAMDDLLGLDMDIGGLSISESEKEENERRKQALRKHDSEGDLDMSFPPVNSDFNITGLTGDMSTMNLQTAPISPKYAVKSPPPKSASEPSSPQHSDPNVLFEHPEAHSDSESDDGGIVMEDNDMEELECEPIPDDYPPFNEGKVAGNGIDEQKFLGSFPRDHIRHEGSGRKS